MSKLQKEIESLRSKLEKLKDETLQNKALEKVTLEDIEKKYDCKNKNELEDLKEEIEQENESLKDEVEEQLEELKLLIKKHGLFDED